MADIKITLDNWTPSKAFNKALLTGSVARSMVEAKGRQVQAAASSMYGASNYGLKVRVGSSRVHAFVYTGDRYAMRSNLKHNTLAKAVKG